MSDASSYKNYSVEVKQRFFSLYISTPAILFTVLGVLQISAAQKNDETLSKITAGSIMVQLAYPVASLDPTIYDDWGSVFVGNHIYYRLMQDKEHPEAPFIARNMKVSCLDSAKSAQEYDKCVKMQVTFEMEEIITCNGGTYTSDDFISELSEIIEQKGWILPHWSAAKGRANEIVLEGRGIEDIYRRFQAVYFRFGWGKRDGRLVGLGPYCLEIQDKEIEAILSGSLHPKNDKVSSAKIDFFTSTEKSNYFNIALYGIESLLSGQRKIISTQTPLGYYLVSNKRFAAVKAPWNTEGAVSIIREHLQDNGMLEASSIFSLNSFLPTGQAIEHNDQVKKIDSSTHSLMLPDYFPDCGKLAEKLSYFFHKNGFFSYNSECRDLVKFHAEYVVGSKKNKFSAFVIPLSPGAPSRSGIMFQYFSVGSPESLTGDFPDPTILFQRLGVGPSNVVVDGERYCNISLNGMGMSNIMIGDFRECS